MNFKNLPFCITFIALSASYAFGQKLPDIQQTSALAPTQVKIDGKFNEWSNYLKASNKTTKLNYTLANDDKNLYLAIKITDATNITKVMAGGINLTINTDNKKKAKDAYVITFPVINRAASRGMRRGFGGQGRNGQPVDSAAIKAAHEQAIAAVKEISVTGFKDITDTLISIYNEYGIKAAVNYDAQGNLVYELGVPLKLLNLSVDKPKEFTYQIMVNGLQAGGGGNNRGDGGGGGGNFGGGGGGFGGGGGGRNGGGGGGGFGGGGGGVDMAELTSPTDFWGKYLLIKP